MLHLTDYYTSPYTWLRVKVGNDVLSDIGSGNTAFTNSISLSNTGNVKTGMSTTGETLSFDLSAYAGQSEVRVTFESCIRYGYSYLSGQYKGMVLVDDIHLLA